MASSGVNEEVLRLRRQLFAAERRIEVATQRIEVADQQIEAANRGRELAEARLAPTTLLTFLDACHIHLSMGLTIQTNLSLSTQGDPANAAKKIRPDRICEWKGFPSQQESVWNDIMDDADFVTEKHFKSISQLEGSGVDWRGHRMSSELDLHHFVRDTVEKPVSSIIKQLFLNQNLRQKFNLKGQVTFENHANMLSAETQVENRMQQLTISDEPRGRPSPVVEPVAVVARPRADQFCVYNTPDQATGVEHRAAAFIIEYKPPHKLSLNKIYGGLDDMELNDVIKRDQNEGPKARFRRLVAAVITQAFSYMVVLGLEYGYVCTGAAYIFLHIPEDPTTVHYFLSVPNDDVATTTGWEPDSDQPNKLHLTAVGQVLAFTLQALRTPPRDQAWRSRAQNQLGTWDVVYDDVLRATSDDKSPPPSEYRPPRSRVMQEFSHMSPVRKSQRIKASLEACRDRGVKSLYKDDDDDDDSFDFDSPSRGPHRPTSLPQQPAQAQPATSQKKSVGKYGNKGKSRQYCSQRCLLGLVNGGPLDMGCPNVLDHGNGRHPINKTTFLKLMHKQLSADLDTDCESVGLQGARGALLKITLTLHGYTVAAKCTVAYLISHLKHEAAVYNQLRPIQGIHVPVYLGNLDLDRPYYYDGMAQLVHMMFLSYGGISVMHVKNEKDLSRLADQGELSIKAMHRLGVLHDDAEARNMLWNPEVDGVMMIDFERSKILKTRRVLGDISSNRKRKRQLRKELNKMAENDTAENESNGFGREARATRNELLRLVEQRPIGT